MFSGLLPALTTRSTIFSSAALARAVANRQLPSRELRAQLRRRRLVDAKVVDIRVDDVDDNAVHPTGLLDSHEPVDHLLEDGRRVPLQGTPVAASAVRDEVDDV